MGQGCVEYIKFSKDVSGLCRIYQVEKGWIRVGSYISS